MSDSMPTLVYVTPVALSIATDWLCARCGFEPDADAMHGLHGRCCAQQRVMVCRSSPKILDFQWTGDKLALLRPHSSSRRLSDVGGVVDAFGR